jgi:hypothetical protein
MFRINRITKPFIFLFLFAFYNLAGQEQHPDSIAQRITELEKAVEALNNKLIQQEQEDELKNLMEEADRLSAQQEEETLDISKKFFSGVRQQQGLNPNISFGADFFAGISSSDNQDISEPSDIFYGNNGFYLREAELSLIAPLDPFTRGKAFLSGNADGIAVDEVYLEWLNLPLHMNLKAGIFKSEFGFLNRYHEHALPQFDRPKALINLFGNEGLGGPGAAANFMLPALLSSASTFDVSLLIGSNAQSFRTEPATDLIITGQYLSYFDLSASSYLEFRISGAGGRNDNPDGDFNSYIGSAGVTYKWAPVGREKYRTIDWKSEFLYSVQEYLDGQHKSYGFYSSIQNKLGARWWLSGRVGYSELPYDPGQDEWDFTLAVDFWQSEFVFTRLQYQYNARDITSRRDLTGAIPSDHILIIQVVWAMGPHKHEAY